jgi:SAM-dependent methyltransferase
MTIASDTFGRALLEAFEGGVGRHMIERDDGRQDWMDAASYFTDAEAWPAPVAEALAELHGQVLDVGCGAGRHARHLAHRGCDVVGIDSSPLAVEICRRRGVRAVVGRLGDGDLFADEQFDGVVMLGHNLGLLASPQAAPGHLRWLAERCRPEALLVGETIDPTRTDDPEHLAYHRRSRAAGRGLAQMRLRVGFADDLGDWFSYWHLTPGELKQVVRETPWRIERLTDNGVGYVAVLRRS